MNHVMSKLKNPYLNSVFATDHNLKTIFYISHDICQTQMRIFFSFCTWLNGTKWHSNSTIYIIYLQTQIEFSWFEKNIYIYSSWSTYTTQTKVTTQSKMLHVLDNFQGIPTKNAFLTIQNLPLAVPKKNFPSVKSSPDYRHGLPLDKRGLFLRPPGSRGANGNQLASRPAGEWRLMMKPQFQNRQTNACFCLYYSSCWTRRVNQRF